MTQGTDIETRAMESVPPEDPENRRSKGFSERYSIDTETPGAGTRDVDVSLVELANVLLKRWKLVLATPFVVAFVAAVISLIVPVRYESFASFVAETETGGVRLPGGLAGLASQIGIDIPGGSGTDSPEFYADILESRTVRDRVLLTAFVDPRNRESGTAAPLLDLMKIKGDSELERLEKGRKKLAKRVSVTVDDASEIVRLSVNSRFPALSAAVAGRYIDLLHEFNLDRRKSLAETRRSFVQNRLSAAEAELHEVEEELETFLESNRQFRGSPELQFQHDRLQRRVAIKQEVLSTLTRQYETARIQELNDIPLITIVDTPVVPDKKSSPKRKLIVVLAFALGGIVGVVVAFGREFAEVMEEGEDEELREMNRHWSSIRSEIGSTLSRLRPGRRS